MNRRAAIKTLLSAGLTTVVPLPLRAAGATVVRFGVITDVHQDIMPDALDRLRAFIAAMTEARVDLVIHLGDFCQPTEANRGFLDVWNTFNGPRYHVLGNHDMDGGFTRDQTVAYYGMPARYYTFDGGTFTGVVLDGNEPGGKTSGYRRFIAAEQCAWLERQLTVAAKPVIVFVHQPLDDQGGVENGGDVRAILERAAAAHPGRVLASLAGHLHVDYARVVGGLPHVMINSAAYYWLGDVGRSTAYFPAEVHAKYRHLASVAAYRDPLWALVEVDLAAGEMRIRGRRSTWIGPPATERGPLPADLHNRGVIRPEVSDRRGAIGRGQRLAASP
jgi:3',5'-cyclic-AMP phosphodiesterase